MSENSLSVLKAKISGLYWNYDTGFSEPSAATASLLTKKEVNKIQFDLQNLELIVETVGEV